MLIAVPLLLEDDHACFNYVRHVIYSNHDCNGLNGGVLILSSEIYKYHPVIEKKRGCA